MTDTITAISTALSEGGIGVIRISGPDAFTIADKIYKTKNGEKKLLSFKSHTIHYGFIFDENIMLDEVMVSVMKAPNTFTREDVVEINCHGGILVCKSILDLVIKNGARLAEPGEFTKRAFLNGRIDLSKAEAVMDLISSKSNFSMRNSINHLQGRLFEKIKALREAVIYEIAFIESAITDPEHFDTEGYGEDLLLKIDSFLKELNSLYNSFSKGKILEEGINTCIVGKPNVGKSSLLNTLTGFDRAIVTDIAGTTRDTIEERVQIGNLSLNLQDTAGIHDTSDKVEFIGVERAKKYAENADLILLLLDASSGLSDDDLEIIDFIKTKKTIVLINKIDIGSNINSSLVSSLFSDDCVILEVSVKEDIGIDKLEHIIEDMFFNGHLEINDELFITNVRQANEIKNCIDSLNKVKESISLGLPEDFYSIDLMTCYTSLGKIIGEFVDDDLADEIFTKFCMGK